MSQTPTTGTSLTLVAIWLPTDSQELTLTLKAPDGRYVYVVVKIDRMTNWLPAPPVDAKAGR